MSFRGLIDTLKARKVLTTSIFAALTAVGVYQGYRFLFPKVKLSLIKL